MKDMHPYTLMVFKKKWSRKTKIFLAFAIRIWPLYTFSALALIIYLTVNLNKEPTLEDFYSEKIGYVLPSGTIEKFDKLYQEGIDLQQKSVFFTVKELKPIAPQYKSMTYTFTNGDAISISLEPSKEYGEYIFVYRHGYVDVDKGIYRFKKKVLEFTGGDYYVLKSTLADDIFKRGPVVIQ